MTIQNIKGIFYKMIEINKNTKTTAIQTSLADISALTSYNQKTWQKN